MKSEDFSKSNHPNFDDSDLLHQPKAIKSKKGKVTKFGMLDFHGIDDFIFRDTTLNLDQCMQEVVIPQ